MNLTIGIRIPKRDRELLNQICTIRGEDISSFVRRSIKKELASLSFLGKEEERALGL